MNSLTKETKLTLLYIFLAYLFTVAVRYIWIYQFSGYEPFMFNGQFMINTNDGYYFAEGARDILAGSHQANDLSPIHLFPSKVTAFFAWILPVSFESVILYMPVYLSALVVIPIILIAKKLGELEAGFIAALLAGIAWSYYNRTMVGYFDTDMLNIVLPMFLLWSIIWAIETGEDKYLLITALDILLYRAWYPASYALEVAIFGLLLVYVLIYDRKNSYLYKLLALMLLAMMMLDEYIRLALVIGAFILFRIEQLQKYVLYIFGASVALFLFSGGLNPVWGKLQGYLFSGSVNATADGMQLHFFNVVKTVREASAIPFETFANRISGHPITFVISVVGYIYLAYKHRIMLLALPMIGLGFLASSAGLRFTIYAVPALALGIAFLIIQISRFIDNKTAKVTFISVVTLAILYPNIKHIEGYKVPTVFNAQEVKLLDELKQQVSREDYIISWWDYGYPLRYYADMKTLIDGGKHSGAVNFPVSYIMTHPQEEAANMARLDVEYTEKNFIEKQKGSNVERMTKEYAHSDTNDFLLSLSTDIELPKKTRDIYFYLPLRMLEIYPTVAAFSNIDLMTGEEKKSPFFFVTKSFKDQGEVLNLGRGVTLNKKTQTLKLGNNKTQLRRFVKTKYDNTMTLRKQVQYVNFSSAISMIYMADYNMILLVDEVTYQSSYIQMFVLEEYDKSLFTLLPSNPHAKIYKLNR